MKKTIENIYWLFAAIFLLLFLYILTGFQINIETTKPKQGYMTISNYSVETLSDTTAPQGIRQRYTFIPTQIEASFCNLIFYSVHQEVIVSVDGEQIYSLAADRHNSFGHTPGSVWNTISLSREDNGKEIQIDFIPVYDSAIDSLPTIYLGERYDIMKSVIIRNIPAMILSAVAIIAGIIYICFVLYAYRKGNADNNLIMLGAFAILTGLWKLTDMEAFSLFVKGHLIESYLPLFTLILACVPYNIFIRGLHSTKKHWAWYIPCVVCYISMFLEITLQLLHMVDFRETLILTHLSILSMVLVVVGMMIYEIRKNGIDKRLKKNIFCILGCMAGLGIDMAIYYVTKGQGALLCGMLGFVVYIFVLGFGSMQEMRKLIAIGQEARKYEKLAYHDEMTGVYNRTAYADYIGKEDFLPDKVIVAMFDLNNLKKCNDGFGHHQGDIYITTCAKLIAEQFSDIGNCYRIGGDEFCVLMRGVSLELCKNRVAALYKKVEKENEKKLIDVSMEIACGYVLYDKRIDYDIQDTVRRADKIMYKEKYVMKHGEAKE